MKNVLALISLALVVLLAFTGTALAAGVIAPDDGSLLDVAKPVLDAIMVGNYAAAAALALVVAVAVAKRYGAPRYPWLASDAGGAVLVLVGSFGGAAATALLAGAAVSTGLAWMALKIAVGAAGGYSLIKKLIIKPLLVPLAARAPAWLQPVFSLIFWVFERPTANTKAELAGAKAVAAKPSTGAGKARDLP